MGNKLCKKKADGVADNPNPKSKSPFGRIITRLHLRPNSWKSDSDLNRKQSKSFEAKNKNGKAAAPPIRPLSKSCDWTDVDLEVPEEKEVIHKKNPQLSFMFSDNTTPTPPPRKHRTGIREKFEAVARSGLQAFQNKKPVDEPLCVKKTIHYGCPLDDVDCKTHNREHKHDSEEKKTEKQLLKETKRKKNLSVVSLPNYNEFKLTVANSDIDIKQNGTHNSSLSLNGEPKTLMTRCRSIGSLLPQQILHKLKTSKAQADVESDDSFGPLEDWDLKIIEHYNPKDSSLPRPRKPVQNKSNKETLSDLDSLIVTVEEASKPVAPVRRSESLLKKLNRKAAEAANLRKSTEMLNGSVKVDDERPSSITPPSSPQTKHRTVVETIAMNFPTKNEEGTVEHSNLLKILEDFSIKDKQNSLEIAAETFPYIDNSNEVTCTTSNNSSLTPSLVEFEKTLVGAVEDFLNSERACMTKELHLTKYGNLSLPQNPIATNT